LKLRKLFLVLILSVIVAYAFYTKYDDDYISPSKYEVSTDVINNIITENIIPTMTDYEKVKTIHDYIVSTTEYDHDNLENNTIPDIDYTAKGVLENHIGVCRGYSEAFKLLMNSLDIDCEIETGYADGISHAWNVVCLEGEWYQVDCTYDDPIDVSGRNEAGNNFLRYDYFLITNEQMYLDHKPDKKLKNCISEKYMYQEKQKDVPYYILSSIYQLPSTITSLYSRGNSKVTFYFPENIDLENSSISDDISIQLGHSRTASQFSFTPVAKCGKYYYTTITVS
jgi:transglutaminase/protease-like cytokinesis protein 3